MVYYLFKLPIPPVTNRIHTSMYQGETNRFCLTQTNLHWQETNFIKIYINIFKGFILKRSSVTLSLCNVWIELFACS